MLVLMLRRSLSFALLLAAFSSSAFAEEGERMRLRVLTYNVWGVPVITPMRAERMARIPQEIARLQPDVVAIQEAWTEEDAETLRAGLAQVGLTYSERHSPEWPNQNGLLIASRYPLRGFHFKPFSQGRRPHVPWHLDYLSGKGVAVVKVETPIGPVSFAATHLQASYGSKDYVFVQMHQAIEAAEQLDDTTHPMIFAGDINSKHDGFPARLLRLRGGLTLSDPEAGIDQILFRTGATVATELVSVKQVLTEPVDLDGSIRTLSDHPGVLAELDLVTCAGRCQPPTLRDRLVELDAELLPLIDEELSGRRFKMHRDLALALSLPMFGMVIVGWRRRSIGRLCGRSRLAAFLLVFAAAWFTYLHVSFGPAHVAGLVGIRGKLAADALHHARAVRTILSRSGS